MAVLVGRDRELAIGQQLVASVTAGAGRLLVVEGDAGAGKTVWCEALAGFARDAGMRVAWAACWESEAQPPLEPWALVLEQLDLPVAALRPDEALDPTLEERWSRFEDVAAAVRKTARATPIAVVLDDIHWADDASLSLLDLVARTARSAPLALVVTARSEAAADARVGPHLARLRRTGERLELRGLDETSTARLLEQAFGRDIPDDLASAWRQHTAGNPLFLLELARGIVGAERLPDTPATLDLPASLDAAFAERLRRCTAGERDVLAALAVLGGEAPRSLVAQVVGHPSPGLLEVVAGLERRSLVTHRPAGPIALVHPMLRTAVLAGLGVAGRVRWHARVAELLLASDGTGRPVDPEVLAHHLVEAAPAGHAELAIRWSLEAARHALAGGAFERSLAWCERAEELLALAASSAAGSTILLQRAEVQQAAGRIEDARASLRSVVTIARRAGDARVLAEAALALAPGGGFEVALFDDEQDAWLQEAAEVLPPHERALRSQVLARLSIARSFSDDLARRAALTDEAVGEARASGDDHALAAALAADCDAHAGPGDTRRRERTATEIVALGRRLRDPQIQLLGHRLRLVALMEDGDSLGVDREIDRFERLAVTAGRPVFLWYVPLWRAARALALGRVDASRQLLARADEIGREAVSDNAEMLVATQLIIGSIELGDVARVGDQLDQLSATSGLNLLGVQMAAAYSFALAAIGRLDEAAALLTRSADEILALPQDSEWAATMLQVAETAAVLGGHRLAEPVYELLAPHGGHHAIEGIGAMTHGAAARGLGRLAGVLGDPAAARRHFDEALASNRSAGLTLAVARTHRDAGVTLKDRDELERALALYRSMGIAGRVAELERLGSPPLASRSNVTSRHAVWKRDGEAWLVGWGGLTASVRDRKGLHDLALLLARPGEEVPALDLYAPTSAAERLSPESDLGDVLDETARRQYRRRLGELERELDDADATGDLGRSERAGAERDALVAQLSSAYGLGGRSRRQGGTAERARTAVTARIRDAVRAVEVAVPPLGRHLTNAVRTGAFCCYDPDEPVVWDT